MTDTNTQAEALRLAAWLNEGAWHQMTLGDVEATGRELRRQHSAIEALESQLAIERRHNERATNHLQDQRDALAAQLAAAQGQPVQVNAMLVEALERIADPRNKHFAGDAQVVANAALTAAKQAQPEPVRCQLCNYQHGHKIGCENNPVDIALKQQAQPERAPSDAQRYQWARNNAYFFGIGNPTPKEADAIVDAAIKQGGQ